MNEALKNIWRVPAYLPFLQPDLTPEIIAETEAKLGIKLPQEYLDILAIQNGGYVRLTLPETVHSQIWGIGPYYPNIAERQWWQDSDEVEEEEWLPHAPERLIPFDGDGHWYLCFDFRDREQDAEPSIIYLALESEYEKPIAPTFGVFLAMLQEPIYPNTIGIVSDDSLAAVVGVLESALNITFEAPDTFAYGYPVYQRQISTDSDGLPETIWLSENEVSRGFIRPSEPRYDELIHRLPGTALRMPDYPEVKFILQYSGGIADRVKNACKQASLRTIPISLTE